MKLRGRQGRFVSCVDLCAGACALALCAALLGCHRDEAPEARKLAPGGEATLLAHWPLDEGEGQTARDASGNGLDGVIAPGEGVWITDPEQGAAFRFAKSHVDCGADARLGNLVRVSYTAWVRLEDYGGDYAGRILSKGSGPDSFYVAREGKGLYYRSDHVGPGGGKGQDGIWATEPGTMKTGAWYFVAMTYDKRLPSHTPTFYINGEYAPARELEHPRGDPAPDAADPLLIGDVAGQTRPFSGLIRDVRVYAGLLSDEEVRALYRERRSG